MIHPRGSLSAPLTFLPLRHLIDTPVDTVDTSRHLCPNSNPCGSKEHSTQGTNPGKFVWKTILQCTLVNWTDPDLSIMISYKINVYDMVLIN